MKVYNLRISSFILPEDCMAPFLRTRWAGWIRGRHPHLPPPPDCDCGFDDHRVVSVVSPWKDTCTNGPLARRQEELGREWM